MKRSFMPVRMDTNLRWMWHKASVKMVSGLLSHSALEPMVARQPTVGGTSETAEGAALGGASFLPSVPEGARCWRRYSSPRGSPTPRSYAAAVLAVQF
ncbi:hypothetical protein OJAV_G00171930 [Oryzias javanicus]|uniref:Uncharacterized protein n=1 Tax=Oryzias javanicus TaxID=123683 RepID=A0A437CFB7_ORYJA|nr:hypothetical protein OJAV_G00171930 [Oryzias javanicus]